MTKWVVLALIAVATLWSSVVVIDERDHLAHSHPLATAVTD